VQRVEELFGAELGHLVHPVAGERGRTQHQGGQRAAVRGLGPGIFLSPEHADTHKDTVDLLARENKLKALCIVSQQVADSEEINTISNKDL